MRLRGSKRRHRIREERKRVDHYSSCKELACEGDLKRLMQLAQKHSLIFKNPVLQADNLLHAALSSCEFQVWEYLVSLPQSVSLVLRNSAELIGAAWGLPGDQLEQVIKTILNLVGGKAFVSGSDEARFAIGQKLLNVSYEDKREPPYPPLIYAVSGDAVHILVKYGADVKHPLISGRSPCLVDVASELNRFSVLKALIAHGASVSAKTLWYAVRGGEELASGSINLWVRGQNKLWKTLCWLKTLASPELWDEARTLADNHETLNARFFYPGTFFLNSSWPSFPLSSTAFAWLIRKSGLPFQRICLILDYAHLEGYACWKAQGKVKESKEGEQVSHQTDVLQFQFQFQFKFLTPISALLQWGRLKFTEETILERSFNSLSTNRYWDVFPLSEIFQSSQTHPCLEPPLGIDCACKRLHCEWAEAISPLAETVVGNYKAVFPGIEKWGNRDDLLWIHSEIEAIRNCRPQVPPEQAFPDPSQQQRRGKGKGKGKGKCKDLAKSGDKDKSGNSKSLALTLRTLLADDQESCLNLWPRFATIEAPFLIPALLEIVTDYFLPEFVFGSASCRNCCDALTVRLPTSAFQGSKQAEQIGEKDLVCTSCDAPIEVSETLIIGYI